MSAQLPNQPEYLKMYSEARANKLESLKDCLVIHFD